MVEKKLKKRKIKTNEEKEADMGEGLQIGNTEVVAHKSQSSVTIKKDAKGKTSFELKVYADDIDVAKMFAVSTYEQLVSDLGLDDNGAEE